MKSSPTLLTLFFASFIVSSAFAQANQPQENYPPHPDSQEQAGVPKGEVLKFTFENSKIFPGAWREYWVYVPAQYTPDKPACVYVNQDGIQWNAPIVFDNLIHKKEMPVTIGVFVMHGKVRAANAESALDRFNRSFEYDGLGPNYVNFLLDELLPDVETKKTSDGRAIRLSKSGNDRAIGGSSSGAICAFTAAWERPDAFSRVFSAIGTYVGLRGGNNYSTLIRKYEPKPIRVFLQDGANDLNIYGGDWWMANQAMERSLVFAGYEVQHVWGEGQHNGKQGSAIFPDAMRWLWKGWPEPVKAGVSKNNQTLDALLTPGDGWQLAGEGYRFTEGPAVNAKGEIFFTDAPNNKIHKIGLDGKVSEFASDSKRANGQAFGPDGRLYSVASGEKKIVAYDVEKPGSPPAVIAEGISGNDIVVARNGAIYVTEPNTPAPDQSNVWLIKSNGEKKVVDTGLRYANGVTLSPDQTLLYVADYRSHWVYSYQIQPDGSLQYKQQYYWIHVADTADSSQADGMRVDRDGRLYVATRMGIQVCDQAGRVNAIIPTPNGRVSNLTFGGENGDTLFATCGDKVYKRKLKVKGANAWDAPLRPAPPRL
ncbi:MAG TPA: SMP-30/gluconolactonase/LRE family protein [Blastocatellia bacterium]|jgi:sugar lactone lactonase YvrE/enterochelin esterase-like enzyme|nr:SMP-30/gluconolactonase/LRE family protein [Blastocatellia bacterium]